MSREPDSPLSRLLSDLQDDKKAEMDRKYNTKSARSRYKATILQEEGKVTTQSGSPAPTNDSIASTVTVRSEMCESFLPDPNDASNSERFNQFARGCHPVLNQDSHTLLPAGSEVFIAAQGSSGSPETTGDIRHCRVSGFSQVTMASISSNNGTMTPPSQSFNSGQSTPLTGSTT